MFGGGAPNAAFPATVVNDPRAAFDGAIGATHGSIPLPSLLGSYGANRTPWRVPGVDYYVGQAPVTIFGTTSTNPTQAQINTASSGATISGSTVTLSGANPFIGNTGTGFTFAANTVITIASGTTGTATIQNCQITLSGQGGQQINCPNGRACNLTVLNTTINGSQFSTSATQNTDVGIYFGGTGALTVQYCYLLGLAIDGIQIQTGASTYAIQWNAFNGIGYSPTAGSSGHPDFIQYDGNASCVGFAAYNLFYAPVGSGQQGDNEMLSLQAQVGAQIGPVTYANNTIISAGSTASPTCSLVMGTFIEDTTSTLLGSMFVNNWIDPSGVKFFPPYYGSTTQLQVTTGHPNQMQGNVLMTTGLPSNPTNVGYVASGTTTPTTSGPQSTDVATVSASPSAGTVGGGGTITFTLGYVRAATSVGMTLTLSNGAVATFTGSGGANSLVFSYLVEPTDNPATNLAITAVNGTTLDQFGNTLSNAAGTKTFSGLNVSPVGTVSLSGQIGIRARTVSLMTTSGMPPTGSFPGQAGNPVGFAATPALAPSEWTTGTWPGAYPGSLTTYPGGTSAKTISTGTNAQSGSGTALDPYIFKFYDMDCGAGGVLVTLSHCRFVGCRIQSNDVQNYAVQTQTGTDVLFTYCSIIPRLALVSQPPFGGGYTTWPSGGAGQNVAGTSATLSISGDDAYQYINLTSGQSNWGHCDIWGAGNGFIIYNPTGQCNITDCWLHDAPNQGSQGYHIDGFAYPNNQVPPTNILIQHCTMGSLGNTEGIGFQGSSSGFTANAYTNIKVDSCYLGGFEQTINMGHGPIPYAAATNMGFTNNTIATDMLCASSTIYNPTAEAAQFTKASNPTNVWSNNTLLVVGNTTNFAGAIPTFTSANNGNFLWPDNTLHTTDWPN